MDYSTRYNEYILAKGFLGYFPSPPLANLREILSATIFLFLVDILRFEFVFLPNWQVDWRLQRVARKGPKEFVAIDSWHFLPCRRLPLPTELYQGKEFLAADSRYFLPC